MQIGRSLESCAIVACLFSFAACRTAGGDAGLSDAPVNSANTVVECREASPGAANHFFSISFDGAPRQGTTARIVHQSYELPAAQFAVTYEFTGLEGTIGPDQYAFNLPEADQGLVVDIYLTDDFAGKATFNSGNTSTQLNCKTQNYATSLSGSGTPAMDQKLQLNLDSQGSGKVIALKSSGADAVVAATGCKLNFNTYIYNGDEDAAGASLELRITNAFGMAGIFGNSLKDVRMVMPPYQDLEAGFQFEDFGFKVSYDGANLTMVRSDQLSDGEKYLLQTSTAIIKTTPDLRVVQSIAFSMSEVLTDAEYVPLTGKAPVRETKATCQGGMMKDS